MQYQKSNPKTILSDKMNCTVGFGKQFTESSSCFFRQKCTRQPGRCTRGTLRKQFTKHTVQFILSLSTDHLTSPELTESVSDLPEPQHPRHDGGGPGRAAAPLDGRPHRRGEEVPPRRRARRRRQRQEVCRSLTQVTA